jgi:hypothetical protein
MCKSVQRQTAKPNAKQKLCEPNENQTPSAIALLAKGCAKKAKLNLCEPNGKPESKTLKKGVSPTGNW